MSVLHVNGFPLSAQKDFGSAKRVILCKLRLTNQCHDGMPTYIVECLSIS